MSSWGQAGQGACSQRIRRHSQCNRAHSHSSAPVPPRELRLQGQLDAQHGAGDGVQLRLEPQVWEACHAGRNLRTRRGVPQRGADLGRAHVLRAGTAAGTAAWVVAREGPRAPTLMRCPRLRCHHIQATPSPHRQHVQGQMAVLQLAQQLIRQLPLKLPQRVLLRPQPQLKRLRAGRAGGAETADGTLAQRSAAWLSARRWLFCLCCVSTAALPPKTSPRRQSIQRPHLAHSEAQLGGRGPAAAEADLKERARDARRVLAHIHQVSGE